MMYYKTLITFVLILLIILVILLSVNTRCSSSSSSSRSVVKEKFQSKIQKVEKGAFLGFPKSRITYTDTGLETTIDTTDKIFYEFNSPTSKIDILNIKTSKFTFMCYFERVSDEPKKQVIVSSDNWFVDLEKEQLRFVYNNKVVKSNISINSNKIYHLAIIVNDDSLTLFVNGNEVKKEMPVSEKITTSIKIGNSKSSDSPFKGNIGGFELINGILLRKEICKMSNYCFNENEKCEFNPMGDEMIDCIKMCGKNENCGAVECQSICLSCNDLNSCGWLEESNNQKQIKPPNAPTIRAVAHDSGQIILDWKAPENNGSNIRNYSILLNESFNKSNGIIFKQLADTKCTSCEYTINGLKNKVYYDIKVAGINEKGMGEYSNTETIMVNGALKNSDVSPLLMESDEEIYETARRSFNNTLNESICTTILSNKKDNHYLNKKRVRFADQIKKELLS